MAKKAKEKYPSFMYVKIEDGGAVDYYVAGTDVIGVAEIGEKVKVGIYRLSEVVEVEGKAVIVR